MLKTFFTFVFSLVAFCCSAQQNQLLSYPDLQMLIQNNAANTKTFLQQKDYHSQPAFSEKEVRFFTLYADNDYTDVSITYNSRRNLIRLITTHQQQAQDIEKALQNFESKDNKGIKTYRPKDKIVSRISLKADESPKNSYKVYTFELES